jgi:hypothetical protein
MPGVFASGPEAVIRDGKIRNYLDVDHPNRIVLADSVFQAVGNSVLCPRSAPSTRRFIRSPRKLRERSYHQNQIPALRFRGVYSYMTQ